MNELEQLRVELAAATTDANDQRQRRKEVEAVNAQIRADNRHLLEAMQSIVHATRDTRGDTARLLEWFRHVNQIATDTLGRVKP